MIMVDKRGMSVEPKVVDGVACFTVRDRHGFLLYPLGCPQPDPRTAEELAALGVDLATLETR